MTGKEQVTTFDGMEAGVTTVFLQKRNSHHIATIKQGEEVR